MVDIVILGLLGGAALRGWYRGAARELLELVGLVLGAWAGIRSAESVGLFLSRWWVGLDPSGARLVGGFAVFVAVGVVASVVGHRVSLRGDTAPGTPFRVGGALLAVVWGWGLVTILTAVLTLSPLGGPMEAALRDSRVASVAIDPDQPAQQALQWVTGDRTLQAALGLQGLLGGQHVILEPGESYRLEPVAPDQLVRDQRRELEVHELLNRARLAAGLPRLTSNTALAAVAAAHAEEMAVGGWFGHVGADGRTVGGRVRAAGVPYRVVGENLALAGTVDIAHQGLMASPGHRANILGPDFTYVGIAVLEGPLGLLVVQVFSG